MVRTCMDENQTMTIGDDETVLIRHINKMTDDDSSDWG